MGTQVKFLEEGEAIIHQKIYNKKYVFGYIGFSVKFLAMDNISSVDRRASRAEILGLEVNYEETEQKRGIPMGQAVPEEEFSAAKLRPISKEASPEPESEQKTVVEEPEQQENEQVVEKPAEVEPKKETAKEKAARIKAEEA